MFSMRVLWQFFHTALLFLYACTWWVFTEVSVIRFAINRLWFHGLNISNSSSIFSEKPIQNVHHIAFVVNEDDVSIPMLCQMVLLCAHFRIDEISITVKSMVKDKVKTLLSAYLEANSKYKISDAGSTQYIPALTVYFEGRSSIVHFLDLDSGHRLLTAVARDLAINSTEEICSKQIENALYSTSRLPPVTLTVLFGSSSTLIGLLPWQSKATEILQCFSHTNFEEADFAKLLTVYSGISQRWGR